MAPPSTSPDGAVSTQDPKFWWKFLERFGLATLFLVGVSGAFWYWSWRTELAHQQSNMRNNETMQKAWDKVGKLTDRINKLERVLILAHPDAYRREILFNPIDHD